MEDYIVRIYRRKKENGGLFGVVEKVGVEERRAFRSMAELVRIIREHHHRGSGSAREEPETERGEAGGA